MNLRTCSLVLLGIGGLGACGPTTGSGTDGVSSGSGSGSGSGSSAGSTGDSGSTSTSPGTTQAPADSSSGPELPMDEYCASFAGDQCPNECRAIRASRETSGCDLDLGTEEIFCVAGGDPLPEGTKTTFYATIEDQQWFWPLGQPCSDEWPSEAPVGWAECDGTPGEPEVCSCLCNSEGCLYDLESDLLESCHAPICGDFVEHGFGEPASEYDLCVLTALRDRTPARVESGLPTLGLQRHRVYIDGSEQAQHLYRSSSGICTSPLNGTWEPNRLCALRPPDFFDACLAAQGPELDDCLDANEWFTGCSTMPASCG